MNFKRELCVTVVCGRLHCCPTYGHSVKVFRNRAFPIPYKAGISMEGTLAELMT